MFDNLTNSEVTEIVVETVNFYRPRFESKLLSAEEVFAECTDNIIRKAMVKNSEDNLTCILIFFKNPLI